MTAAQSRKAVARELRSVARYLRRCAEVCSASSLFDSYGRVRGFIGAADYCNRRASKLTAKAKAKGRK